MTSLSLKPTNPACPHQGCSCTIVCCYTLTYKLTKECIRILSAGLRQNQLEELITHQTGEKWLLLPEITKRNYDNSWPMMIAVTVMFHFIVVAVVSVCSLSLATLKVTFFQLRVTCGARVVVDATSEIPTSFHHFNHSDSACKQERTRICRVRVDRRGLGSWNTLLNFQLPWVLHF